VSVYILCEQKNAADASQRAVLEQSLFLGYLLFLAAEAARVCRLQLLVGLVVAIGVHAYQTGKI